jgi:chemotaxis response regulator CheB
MANRNRKSSDSKIRRRKSSASEGVNKTDERATEQGSTGRRGREADPFRIVAIGGSSGSLDALERLLHALSHKPG